MEKSLVYIISEQGGMSARVYWMLLWHDEGHLNEVSSRWVLSYQHGFLWPFLDWQGGIVFLALFLVMVTLASLSGCIIYLTDQQEDGDINLLYPMLLWYRRLSQCYKLKHGFYYIYSLYGPLGTGTKALIMFIIMFLMLFHVVSLVSLTIKSLLLAFYERLIDIDLVLLYW